MVAMWGLEKVLPGPSRARAGRCHLGGTESKRSCLVTNVETKLCLDKTPRVSRFKGKGTEGGCKEMSEFAYRIICLTNEVVYFMAAREWISFCSSALIYAPNFLKGLCA